MRKTNPTTAASLVCALVLALGLVFDVAAQTGTSTVRGTVTDAQGQVIAGATVTIRNDARNLSRTTQSSATGTYIITALPPGDYVIEAEATGFKKSVTTNVKTLVDTASTIDLSMEVGQLTEVVTVSSDNSITVNTQDGTLGTAIGNNQIIQLPLPDRNPAQLLTLQAGVTKEGFVTGARSDQSNITLDGVDINEAQTNSLSAPVLRLNAEAIQEFRVTTANANASQGRSSGAQISLVTKGGSNEFSGAAFYGGRNDFLDANDFFNNRTGTPRPTRRRHFYGGAIGGPIVENRVFFFYSYEGLQEKRGVPVTRTVPLPSLGQGIVRYRDAGTGAISQLTAADIARVFPNAGTNPAAIAALADAARRYPANDFNAGDSAPGRLLNTAGFRFNAPITEDRNSHIARFDFNISSKHQVFARGNYIYDLLGNVSNFPDTPAPSTWSHPLGYTFGHTWTISNSIINNFRYGMTRDSFSNQGDSAANAVSFRFIYSPFLFSRSLNRTTPVQNITNDTTWTKGSHTMQFGTNIRLIRNRRESFANSFDNAITNPSFYPGGGTSINSPIVAAGFNIANADISNVQNAVTALVGRFSQFAANFIFGRDGALLPSGSATDRTFATEEYDLYMQDSWKIRPNLTLTYGLRYGISKPVYEQNGFEVKPTVSLGDYFQRRIDGMKAGRPLNELITLDLSGPANGRTGAYRYDKNNFQPRAAISWSPDFKSGLLHKLFGDAGKSVLRGGFSMFNDYYGNQLAVSFDLNNTIGFTQQAVTAANTFNLTTNPGPRFTGFGQSVRGLPGIVVPGNITWPRTPRTRAYPGNIEGGLDDSIIAPTQYNWNFTIERELPFGALLQLSYIGRKGRNLLASRDIMSPSNLVDPRSGIDWYTAAGQLEVLRSQGRPVSSIQQSPYFANLFPANLAALLGVNSSYNQTQAIYAMTVPRTLGGENFYNYGNDWTSVIFDMSTLGTAACNPVQEGNPLCHMFMQPQWGTLGAWSSIGNADYHGGTVSLRQRFGSSVTADFNYTLSKSFDDASGLMTAGVTGGNAFIVNPFRQRDSYSVSDFDARHIINSNVVWQLPFGRGQKFGGGISRIADTVLGGWQLSSIIRYNSGQPVFSPYDDARWATNWNVQSNAVRTRPVNTCPVRGGALFGCNTLEAFQSFRNPLPGETGDRNAFRNVGTVNTDLGIGKSFKMPYSEKHNLQLRWEVFNLFNYQAMGAFDTSRSGLGIPLDPGNKQPPVNWTRYTGIQGSPRFMQLFLRYSF